MKDLGDRMKRYEAAYCSAQLPINTPCVIRVDGRAFHTFTRGLAEPFDANLRELMAATAKHLCQEITGARFAYTQSDEISVLLTDHDKHETQPWFDYDLLKISTLAASMATAFFNHHIDCLPESHRGRLPHFDGRAFSLPREEVVNYYIWRQKDWQRNSLNMLAGHHFPAKVLDGLNAAARHDLLHSVGVNWLVSTSKAERDGVAIVSTEDGWQTAWDVPEFTKDREFVRRHVADWPTPQPKTIAEVHP